MASGSVDMRKNETELFWMLASELRSAVAEQPTARSSAIFYRKPKG